MGSWKLLLIVVTLLISAGSGGLEAVAQNSATELFAQGYALLEAGDAQPAVDKFEAGLKAAPQNPLAHFFLGKAYFTLGKYQPAQDHLKKSLEIDPTNQYSSDARLLLQKIADALARVNREIADWSAANGSRNAAPLGLYLREFPNGEHAIQARSQLAEVAEEQARQAKLAQEEAERQADLARAAAEEAKRPWTDPTTGIQWTKQTTNSVYDWSTATDYCQSLQLDGHDDWRLPKLGELQRIFDAGSIGAPNAIELPAIMYRAGGGSVWTSDTKGKEAWIFNLRWGHRLAIRRDSRHFYSVAALCVRQSTQ